MRKPKSKKGGRKLRANTENNKTRNTGNKKLGCIIQGEENYYSID